MYEYVLPAVCGATSTVHRPPSNCAPPLAKQRAKRQELSVKGYVTAPGEGYTFTNRNFGSYIRYHHYERPFFVTDHSEALRYGPVAEFLRRKEADYVRGEDRVRQIRCDWLSLRRRRSPFGVSSSALAAEAAVDGAASAIDVSRSETRLADEKGKHRQQLSERSTYGLLHTFKTISISGATEEPAHVKVRTSLMNTTYYQGYAGGDYVMRYRAPQNTMTNETQSLGQKGNSKPAFNAPEPLDDPIPLNARQNFTYCGQVPRPIQEYLYRMEIVLADVIAILTSGLCFHLFPSAQAMHPHFELLTHIQSATNEQIGDLYSLWTTAFAKKPFPDTLREDIRHCARIHEFAYLFEQLRHRAGLGELLLTCSPVILLLEHATEWPLYHMIDIEVAKRAAIAEHCIFEAKEFDHIFIFESANVEVSRLTLAGVGGGGGGWCVKSGNRDYHISGICTMREPPS